MCLYVIQERKQKRNMAKTKPTYHECKVCGLIVKHSWGLSDHMRRKHTNERPYLCDSCPKSFPKQYELKRHYVIHTGEKPYKCSICPESYRSRISRNVHEDSHGILRHKCEFCEIVFFHREEKYVHQKKVHHSISDTKFECRDCHKIFGTEKFLMLHKKVHIGTNIQCPTCQLTFTKKRELKIHERSHLEIKKKRGRGKGTWIPHSCHVCNETFSLKYDIIRHFSKYHPADKGTLFNQKCKYCEKAFSTKNHLDQHLVSHSNERNFPCSKCGYKAKRQRDLDIHEINVHSRKGLHQCPYCEKSFPVISVYRGHINKHENNRCFQCQLCEKAYYSQRQLRGHLKIHNDKINGKMDKELCSLCGKLLAATFMPKHLKNHEVEDKKIEKPTISNKRIFSKENLTNKKISLQDVNEYYRYKCKKCSTRFKMRSEQFKHQETCVKKICAYCKMVFSDELECEVHVDSDHYDKLYQCSICKKKFRNNAYLISHKVSHKVKGYDNYNYRNKQTIIGGYYFECFVCGILCGSEDSLNKHIEHHKTCLCLDKPFNSKLFDTMNCGPSFSDPDDAMLYLDVPR